MKIGFFGTPEIAAHALERLAERFDIAFVVTGEDKPIGRHLHVQPCPAKAAASARNIETLHPAKLRDEQFVSALRPHGADIFVVVAYGRLIPREVFAMPRLGTINLHPSLLPRYRGAAPVEWALIRGETETGVTVQLINDRLDAGDIVIQKKIPLDDAVTAGGLYKIVTPLGADMLVEAIELLDSGKAAPVKQDESQATFCGKITAETAGIDWSRLSLEIHNLVRGLNPKPGASTGFREMLVKIWTTAPFPEPPREPRAAGSLIVHQKKRLLAATGDGCVEILTLQPERKKIMDALSFINGYRLQPDSRFEPHTAAG
ncbi:MAG: methionyl-tRNA formyltransferase [Spirochaetes bacterium]|nr:MAG: methionyl-tRNA formyltransferase [Spirochaetota bacterium]